MREESKCRPTKQADSGLMTTKEKRVCQREQKGMKYTDMEITLPVTKAEGWENKLGVWD